MDLKLPKLGVAVEEVDQIDLGKSLEHLELATELNFHHKVLHLASTQQPRADGSLAPLDIAHREVFQIWELPSVHLVHPPCIVSSQFTTHDIAFEQHKLKFRAMAMRLMKIKVGSAQYLCSWRSRGGGCGHPAD
jgi:hypothetical protein